MTVLTYGSRSGSFATVTGATVTGTNLPGGLALQQNYGPSALSIEVVTP